MVMLKANKQLFDKQKEARQWQEQAPKEGGDDDSKRNTGPDTGGHLSYITGAEKAQAQTLIVRIRYPLIGRMAGKHKSIRIGCKSAFTNKWPCKSKGQTERRIEMYYFSWSERGGEATYTRCFGSREERDKFGADFKRCPNYITAEWNK